MRALLAIGCNNYDHLSQLTGAEKDAQRMFDVLLRPEVGQYDIETSKLLLSPSLEEVRQALRAIFIGKSKMESFTLFFAGHGGVVAGSFYMWLRDSSQVAPSMTAWSLSELFRSLNEVAPNQSNIIIDACESGGLISDLGTILKQELLGDAGTPALTLVATSAKNEGAGENDDGGLGTNAILDCIEGREFINDSASVLDLVQIGQKITTLLKGQGQSPIVWGLNLNGPPSFCRNAKYASDPSAPLRNFVQNWPADSTQPIKEHYDELWSSYSSIDKKWDVKQFFETVDSVLTPLSADPILLSKYADRLASTFLVKAQESQDAYIASQISACLVISLLPKIGEEVVAEAARNLLRQCSTDLLKANGLLVDQLIESKYGLISKHSGGLAGLYLLPMRVAYVLGWAALATVISGDENKLETRKQFTSILRMILEHYSGTIVALTDAQAPFWALTLHCAKKYKLSDEAEQLAGLLFASVVACEGRLLRSDIDPKDILKYLIARNSGDYSQCMDNVERPIETLTVLLKISRSLALNDVFDESLWRIDGLNFSAYMPADYSGFNAARMESGDNLFWGIGHDVFKTADLEASWPSKSPVPRNLLEAQIATVSSLIHSDRIPWFYLEDENLLNNENENVGDVLEKLS